MPPAAARWAGACSQCRVSRAEARMSTHFDASTACCPSLRLGPSPTRRPEMSDRDDFLTWVRTVLYEAELALHNGDAGPRRAIWSRNEPVSVLGAWRNANGQQELDELFEALGASFSDCTSYRFELQACDVVGDMAY